jgi:hypothetical protein
MKEIHAYRNEDGTYRIRAICDDALYGDQWCHVAQDIPRAKIHIEALADYSSGKIFDIEVADEVDDEDDYI